MNGDTQIKFPEMVRVLAKDGQVILDGANASSAHNIHMAVGIIGEIGELIEALYYESDNILEELGDTEFYMEGLRQNTPCIRLQQITPEVLSFTSISVRLTIEGCNLIDIVKKEFVYGQTLDTSRLQLSLNAIDILLSSTYHRHGYTRDQAIEQNMQKLGKRYRDFKYTDESAKLRADKS